jgi:4a-hydroxytetrahydrobiopterin dehydratase
MPDKDITYSPAQIDDQLQQLPGWVHADGSIRRAYETSGWPVTLMLVNAIGFCAELANHHPDLTVSWGRVVVALSTHSAGGVTDKDFELARRCDEVAHWQPAEGTALAETSQTLVRGPSPS